MTTFGFEPLISPALWLTLAAAGLGLMAWYGWRRPAAVRRLRWSAILALMATGLISVLIILLNPTWVKPVAPPAGKPSLTILVDATASMATPDAAGGHTSATPSDVTRYQAAVRLARFLAGDLADRFEVHVATFADSVTPVDGESLAGRTPTGQLTDIAGALSSGLAENRAQGQALILLSDGIHNAGGGAARVLEAVRLARAMACPIYTRTYGGESEVKDLAVELRSPQELAFVGQKVPIFVHLRQRGLSGGRATLALQSEGVETERREVPLSQEVVEVQFQVRQEKTGLYRYEVRAEPMPGEISLVNNSAPFLLRVVDEPIKVLLLEGKPYWDAKFLMRTLLGDPSLELESVVRLGERRLMHRKLKRGQTGAATTPGFKPADARAMLSPGQSSAALSDSEAEARRKHATPVVPAKNTAFQEEWKIVADFAPFLAKPDGLRSYQILVLGRDAEVFLTEPVLAQLREWIVKDGGSLVCFRGQPMTQVNQLLGQLLPLRWNPARESRFHINLTERGRDLRWFPMSEPESPTDMLSHLPSLATTSQAENPKPLAVVLATARSPAERTPVVTYQPYGSGRVVVIEGAGMWRWAFLPPHPQPNPPPPVGGEQAGRTAGSGDGAASDDDVYRSLWHSLLRWLVSSADLLPGQKLALRSDKISFGTLEPATATLLMREEGDRSQVPSVELTGEPLKAPQTVVPVPMGDEPGTYRVLFGKLAEGRYQARVTGSRGKDPAATTAFDVRSLFEEQLDLKARPDLMARIAQESGGAVLTGDTPKEIVARFREHLDSHRPQQVRRLSAWDRWWVLTAVFGVWGMAWAIRRWGGLV